MHPHTRAWTHTHEQRATVHNTYTTTAGPPKHAGAGCNHAQPVNKQRHTPKANNHQRRHSPTMANKPNQHQPSTMLRQRPTTTINGQRRRPTTTKRPTTTANNGQRGPTTASNGQQWPTTAIADQQRPTTTWTVAHTHTAEHRPSSMPRKKCTTQARARPSGSNVVPAFLGSVEDGESVFSTV